VVGGGLSGLAAAHRLAGMGAIPIVFEAATRPGGRVVTDEVDGYTIDVGAQLFGGMYQRFARLAGEVGLGGSLIRVPGRDALWRNGRAHGVVYGSVASMVASGGLPLGTKMRLGARYVPFLNRHAPDLDLHAPELAAAADLDDESIASWGRREIDDTFVDALVYPQLGAFYGSEPEETSAGFYHILARYGMDVSLFAVAGGAGRVAEAVAGRIRQAGGEIRLGAPVRSIQLEEGARIVCADGSEDFDGVISAVPAPDIADLLSGAPVPLLNWLGAVRYRPALSLALLLDAPVRDRFFGLSFPRGETRWVAAVAIQENKGVPLVPAGMGLLVAFPTPETAPALIDMTSREILDRMLPEIARAFPGVEGRVRRARVSRWPRGNPVFFPGYLAHLGAFRRGNLEGSSPLALAGDFLFGPSVEGAVTSGLDAADRLASRMRAI